MAFLQLFLCVRPRPDLRRATKAALASARPFPSPIDAVALRVRSPSGFCCAPLVSSGLITRDLQPAARSPTTPKEPGNHDTNDTHPPTRATPPSSVWATDSPA